MPASRVRLDPSFAFAAGLVLLALLTASTAMANFDIWSHLRGGELILERGEIPRTDLFTTTRRGSEWVNLHWGFQVVAAALFGVGGAGLLVAFKAALTASAVALGLLARRRGWPSGLVTAAWLPGLLAIGSRSVVRPEVLTLLFLAAFLCILFHAGRRPRLVWLLPCVQLLWVNSQGLFALGPVVLALFWLDRIADALLPARGGDRPGRLGWAQLVGASVAVSLACLANPWSLRGALLPFELFAFVGSGGQLTGSDLLELAGIGDRIAAVGWAAALREPGLLVFAVTFVLAVASFGAVGRRPRVLFRLLLLLAFSFLAWQALRNLNLFGLVAGYVTAWNLAEARESLPEPRPGLVTAGRAGLGAAMAGLALAVVAGGAESLFGRSLGWRELPNWYAHDACRFAARPGMPPHAFVANLGQSAVCIYHLAPERTVFLDANFGYAPAGRRHFEEYRAVLAGMASRDRAWEETLRTSAGTDASVRDWSIVLDHRMAMLDGGGRRPVGPGLAADPGWRCVYSDAVAGVFVRAEVAAALGLPAVDLRPAGTLPGP